MKDNTILIVDDTPANLDIISSILQMYDVIAVTNGYDAIEMLKNETIDLILLDIMMPQIDGFKTCELIKNDANLCNIPLIFITAKSMEEDVTRGFKLGALDYITKPFNPSELLARVQTHLDLYSYKKELETKVAEEIEKNKVKQQLLFQHSKQAAIGELLMHIAHQWKQPLSELCAINTQTRTKLDLKANLTQKELQDNCHKIDKITEFMSTTTKTFQDFYKPVSKQTTFYIVDAIEKATNIISATYEFYSIDLKQSQKSNPRCFGNENEYAQVILNLLNNAKDIFIQRQVQKPQVTITIASKNDKSYVSICDNAGGFEKNILKNAYKAAVSSTNSTGLGLYMSKAIIEKNKGFIKITNSKNGACIAIVL